MGKESIAQLEKEPFKRKLGIGDLFAIGYGDLGSSIYYALGITASFALGATPIALLLAGVVFICTALTYAEMTATFKDSGGSASFARRAFNDLISFIAGWGLLLDYIVTIAISIFAIAPYLAFIHGTLKEPSVHLGFSCALIGVLFLLNLFGVKHSTRISLLLTGFTLLTQFIIIAIGFFTAFPFTDVAHHMRINEAFPWSPSWGQFWKGTAMAMVAYTGIESIAQLGAETRHPVKTLPRAVILVMFVLILMYLGISVVGLSLITPKELGTTYVNDPIAGIVQHLSFGNEVLAPWIGLLAAILLFVAANAGLLGASRLSFNMGQYYQLPRFFSYTQSKFRTPVWALAFFAILSTLLVLMSRGILDILADLYNFGAMIAFFSAHASLIALRIKQPDLKRPFRAPLNISIKGKSVPLTALIGALATLSVWVLVVITKPEGRYVGFGWMILGVTMYLFYRRHKRLASTGQLQIEKIKIPRYKPIHIKHILVPVKSSSAVKTLQLAAELARLHKAQITAIHIVEVPYSLPLDAALPPRKEAGQVLLQQAEAIAGESDVTIGTGLIRAREEEEAILQILGTSLYDLVILEAPQGAAKHNHFKTERILREAPCPVLVYSG
jgi:APA family basic amino acid/polyamine antiporter